jgi:ABC-type uncharacterized transport system substrate-binding protein
VGQLRRCGTETSLRWSCHVEQATRIRLVINLKTAKALGVDLPEQLLDRAADVIK